ncbi:hypothetical protein ABZ897_35255 [Nonomuraea sp. NPDC046802]|uniref:hypothetical protein n=1 Tax=Nonomuraea sp. NPDC046802 TaxID=3154919 RepID=UPI0033FD2B1A
MTITQVFHSHAKTRTYTNELLGREGVIVAELRNGNVALVELDGDPWVCPAGARRWSFEQAAPAAEAPATMARDAERASEEQA